MRSTCQFLVWSTAVLTGCVTALAARAHPALAHVSGVDPVARAIGARYAGHARDAVTRTVVHISLTVDDDGGEFADYSRFEADPTCPGPRGHGGTSSQEDLSLTGPDRAVQIRPDGYFRYRERASGEVRGRFVDHGREVVGTVRLHFFQERRRCSIVRARFRLGIVGFPARRPADGLYTCDRLTVAWPKKLDNDEAYRVVDHGRGCTRARADAVGFHSSTACRALSDGQTCTVGDATCQAIRGGFSGTLASARCWSTADPSQDAELTHLQPCRSPAYDSGTLETWAVNLDCASARAFPFNELAGHENNDTGPCGHALSELEGGRAYLCAPVGGFNCSIRAAAVDLVMQFRVRCINIDDPFLGTEFFVEI